jgi:Flp pilus assembly protein TadD
LNNLAWLLAISPNEKLRNGKEAVELARRACELSDWKDPSFIGTMAAASAEVGNFDDAVKWQRKSLELGVPEIEVEQAHRRLKLYEQRKPFHENE